MNVDYTSEKHLLAHWRPHCIRKSKHALHIILLAGRHRAKDRSSALEREESRRCSSKIRTAATTALKRVSRRLCNAPTLHRPVNEGYRTNARVRESSLLHLRSTTTRDNPRDQETAQHAPLHTLLLPSHKHPRQGADKASKCDPRLAYIHFPQFLSTSIGYA